MILRTSHATRMKQALHVLLQLYGSVVCLKTADITNTCPSVCECTYPSKTSYEINCNGQNLTAIPRFEYVQQLPNIATIDLYLNDNQISHVILLSLSSFNGKLRTLELQRNRKSLFLPPLVFDAFAESLEVLKVDNLAIDVNEALQLLSHLKRLRILKISVSEPPGTTLMRLRKYHPHEPLYQSMRELNINRCGIRYVASDAFYDFPRLKILTLAHNRLKFIPDALRPLLLLSLEELDLQSNEIQVIRSSDFPFLCKLQTLNLRNNKFLTFNPSGLAKCPMLRDIILDGISHITILNNVTSFMGASSAPLRLHVSCTPSQLRALRDLSLKTAREMIIEGCAPFCGHWLQFHLWKFPHHLQVMCKVNDGGDVNFWEYLFIHEESKRSTGKEANPKSSPLILSQGNPRQEGRSDDFRKDNSRFRYSGHPKTDDYSPEPLSPQSSFPNTFMETVVFFLYGVKSGIVKLYDRSSPLNLPDQNLSGDNRKLDKSPAKSDTDRETIPQRDLHYEIQNLGPMSREYVLEWLVKGDDHFKDCVINGGTLTNPAADNMKTVCRNCLQRICYKLGMDYSSSHPSSLSASERADIGNKCLAFITWLSPVLRFQLARSLRFGLALCNRQLLHVGMTSSALRYWPFKYTSFHKRLALKQNRICKEHDKKLETHGREGDLSVRNRQRQDTDMSTVYPQSTSSKLSNSKQTDSPSTSTYSTPGPIPTTHQSSTSTPVSTAKGMESPTTSSTLSSPTHQPVTSLPPIDSTSQRIRFRTGSIELNSYDKVSHKSIRPRQPAVHQKAAALGDDSNVAIEAPRGTDGHTKMKQHDQEIEMFTVKDDSLAKVNVSKSKGDSLPPVTSMEATKTESGSGKDMDDDAGHISEIQITKDEILERDGGKAAIFAFVASVGYACMIAGVVTVKGPATFRSLSVFVEDWSLEHNQQQLWIYKEMKLKKKRSLR